MKVVGEGARRTREGRGRGAGAELGVSWYSGKATRGPERPGRGGTSEPESARGIGGMRSEPAGPAEGKRGGSAGS